MTIGKNNIASSSSYSIPVAREDTPLLLNTSQHTSSNFKTCAKLFIAVVGAGVLGLPYSFKKTGWAMGQFLELQWGSYHFCMLDLVFLGTLHLVKKLKI
ncbi:hypothetical protein LIER_19050 [Lithospermum erythrorhizon]|uniref:Amino acid transporter transmembrane domain-containing protein n=1 Tax=Lithospermum erythrorhizon TaxID=34254 RepID=A0AAV3QIJ9_LITER